jgi:hypothetical protein
MTHHKEIIESLLKKSTLDFQKDAFFVSIYEADLNDIANAQEFIKMLDLVDIDNTDELGYTPLAVAAVIKESPELTRTILSLKPDVNYMMDELYTSKIYKAKEKEIKTKTVLDLIENAQSREENAVKKENLSTIRDLLLQHGAKTAAAVRQEEKAKATQLATEKLAAKKAALSSNPANVTWDF